MAVIPLFDSARLPGVGGFLLRVRDLVDRGKLNLGELRIADLVGWLWRAQVERAASIGELCSVLEGAARLVLVKARRLSTGWQQMVEEAAPWPGPPPELAPRRSWLAERVALGPHCFTGPARPFERTLPPLQPVAPDALRRAMLAVLSRERPAPAVVGPRVARLPVETAAQHILEQLAERGQLRLTQIIGDSRDAHVAAFLACLTLARQGRVILEQEGLFGEIYVRPAMDEMFASA